MITLLTDFGWKDGYPGIMKGVISSIHPQAQIVDISHEIPPQHVLEGALTIGRAYPYFPADTIHVMVVDPGVGTSRRPIAARIGQYYYVCPDNGLITIPYQSAGMHQEQVEIVHLNQPQFWLPNPSTTFHGRDIFSPVAAHLALGIPLEELGIPVHDPILLDIPQPTRQNQAWHAQIIHIDRFGNLGINLSRTQILSSRVRITIKDHIITDISPTFCSHPPGSLVAIWDSSGYLSLCIVNGSAEEILSVELLDPVLIEEQ